MTLNELKYALADRIEPLAVALMGTAPSMRTHHEIRFGTKGALSVRVSGPKRGTFCDYAGSAKGDGLALIKYARHCDTREAFHWACAWLTETHGGKAPRPATKPTTPFATYPQSKTADLGQRLWREAVPPQGTLAEAYVRSRGLVLEPDPPIRFHPQAWRHRENGPPGPAMLALMTCPKSGEERGTHLTYVRRDGVGKAEGGREKIMLGAAGIIRLSPDEEVTLGLGLAEGIETGLAVMQHFGWRPVWSAVSAGGIGRFPVLRGIESLTIFADQDVAGIQAARTCSQRWREAGRQARILAPPDKGDFDDLAKILEA
jgi:putative DNA primase/helicase